MSAVSNRNKSKRLDALLQQYIDSLRNKDIKRNIHQLYLKIYEVAKPATRAIVRDATSGCRFWQLVYVMLWKSIQDKKEELLTILGNVYELKNKKNTYMPLYKSLLERCKITVSNIQRDRGSNLYKIIFGNDALECLDNNPPCITPYDATYHEMITSTTGIYYMCIYLKRPKHPNHPDRSNTISHYFTVVHVNRKYYIISSYGCDYICASYDVLDLNMGELSSFYNALEDVNNEANKGIITAFYEKYFLHNSNPPYCSDDLVEGNPVLKWTRVVNGPQKEIHDVFDQVEGTTFHIGIFREYASTVQMYMPSLGGARRTRRACRGKKRSTRRRV